MSSPPSNSVLPPPPTTSTAPSPHKTYIVTATTLSRTTVSIKPKNHSEVQEYTCDLSFTISDLRNKRKSHSVVLHSSPDNRVVGIADIDSFAVTKPVHLCFGDPDAEHAEEEGPGKGVVWEDMHCQERMKTNCYELSIDLGLEIGRKVFVWKRTHSEADGSSGGVMKKLDFLSFKMEEKETGVVVARFVHYPWVGLKRGEFEFLETVGEAERWVQVVILSGMGLLEYVRKIAGWSL